MSKEQKLKYGAVVVAIVAAYAFGRFSAPEKVKIEKEYVKVEDKTKNTNVETDLQKKKNKKITVVEITRPDGTKEVTTVVEEKEKTNKQTDKNVVENTKTEITKKESKEITNSSSIYSLSALAGVQLLGTNLSTKLKYGGHIQRNLIGPTSIGVFGLSDGTIGMSLGLIFK